MTNTVTNQDSNLLLYLQICADSYSENMGKENPIGDSNWEKLNLILDNKTSGEYYYDYNNIYNIRNGFDAAIYYNAEANEVIVGIRGTEVFANDGDVEESANILNESDNLTQFNELKNFHTVIMDTLSSINFTGTYKVVGQSLVRRLGFNPTT